MPGGDRTGPMGAGPQTGRGMGICAGFFGPGYANPSRGIGRMMRGGRGMGRGMGRGRGGSGRGFGRGWWKMPAESANPESKDNKEE